MAYPEKGASYRNKPAWMDRAVAGEKRAEGGGLLPEFEGAAEDSKEDLQNAMRHGSYEKGFNAGDYKGSQRGPTPTNASNLKFYRKHGDTQAEAVKNSLKYKTGGRVRRADGGPLIDSKGRTLENPDNDFTTNSPPARLVEAGSSHAAQDAREQAAARIRRTRAMPDSFPVGGTPKRATGGGIDAGTVEDRGSSKANPGPSSADWRGSKWKDDHSRTGQKPFEPMGEDTGMAAAATKDHGYMGRKAGGRVRRRAEGGFTSDMVKMGPPDTEPTDPTISAEDVKTWGTPNNARAAARARDYAKENPYANRDKDAREHMGRGIGQSIGFKRGGKT